MTPFAASLSPLPFAAAMTPFAAAYAFCGNDCVERIDLLGNKLTPNTDDISSLKLTLNERPFQNESEIFEAGEAGIIWPLDIVKRKGKAVEIHGKMTLNPTYRNNSLTEVSNPETQGKDRQGRTVANHERGHGAIAKQMWNSQLAKVNYWEGVYCSEDCAVLAEFSETHINLATLYTQAAMQSSYDLEAYAAGTRSESRFTFLKVQYEGQAKENEKMARKYIQQFISSSCYKGKK